MVAFVAVALSADRAIAAAPALRPEMAETARKVVNRIVVSFRRTIPTIRLAAARRHSSETQQSGFVAVVDQWLYQHAFSPFEFRLPPPAV